MTRLPRLHFPSVHTRRRSRLLAGASTLAAALALGGCNNFSGEEQRQADVISAFYTLHLKTNAPGLPPADELRQYQPLVSRALYTLLTQAEAADVRYHTMVGNQAPPIVEGDLFTSLYEGATSFSVKSCDSDDQRSSCQVAFEYKKDGAAEAWNDKILLVREDNRWRIDDIEFIGNDQSSQREYLSDTLADAIKEAE
ncbi:MULTISPECIES: DUF3828 domain-containing protein [unclassified Herbaspirillum]|uniref:DUF3828 domain-containing protein n=1 Tax=unclassified Herbaspirillum TaxID=2624150 RepID=UPI00114E9C38|nr:MULTISPECIES: DUF3828 domain-containing protein [unclassified Herbaspirillum]MBB5391470.1 anti-sigma factor RsiW [Herbaspirillum sp. SJZ102]TQK12845.1 uncharacterized protein DUF3828 [Herbaspirillum sp. SJZ130]TQK14849.1 uncharacterized protein DUF3828 [Herbaspirillum sp. SJZ106]TWC67204.1 uncharacterized protein DUF3828 [Herbaspirillum sp. SJZ099]